MRKEKNQKLFGVLVGIIIILMSIILGMQILSPVINDSSATPGVAIQPSEEQPVEPKPVEPAQPKEYVQIVFIGKNDTGEEVYKVIKREHSEKIDGPKLQYALTSLIMGPTQNEKAKGIYSEVPTGTVIKAINETSDKVIIDLSSEFVTGGGTDSVYKRLYQLIKTVNRNSEKPAYLYIDGKQADVIGGDGIMITQPLNENSIGE